STQDGIELVTAEKLKAASDNNGSIDPYVEAQIKLDANTKMASETKPAIEYIQKWFWWYNKTGLNIAQNEEYKISQSGNAYYRVQYGPFVQIDHSENSDVIPLQKKYFVGFLYIEGTRGDQSLVVRICKEVNDEDNSK